MKKLIRELPFLTTLIPKEILYVYLTTSQDAVSGVLLAERKGKQTPIRYVHRTLHEAEWNYAPLEKLALCLLHLSRRLRRYFEAHPNKLQSDSADHRDINSSSLPKKLAKSRALGAYYITYVSSDMLVSWQEDL
ncbi:reverse transcriptase domain-containing protein [Tanacetum coccineum]